MPRIIFLDELTESADINVSEYADSNCRFCHGTGSYPVGKDDPPEVCDCYEKKLAHEIIHQLIMQYEAEYGEDFIDAEVA